MGAAAVAAPVISGCSPGVRSNEAPPNPGTPMFEAGKPPDVLPAPKPILGGNTLPDGSLIHVFVPCGFQKSA